MSGLRGFALLNVAFAVAVMMPGCYESGHEYSPGGDVSADASGDGETGGSDADSAGDFPEAADGSSDRIEDAPGSDVTSDEASETIQETTSDSRYPACDPTAVKQTVTFVHVNDLHGSYTLSADDARESPWARLAGYVKQVRSENPYTIFTDGGDDHEKGSVAEQYSHGLSTVEAIRAMKFDVRVIGNHDFAWGPGELLEHTRDENAVVLSTNTVYSGANVSDWGAVQYAEMNVGCLKIGFFGLHPHPYDEMNESYEGPYYPGNDDFVTRYDYADVVREIVEKHRAGVDLLVMVSHLGIGTDRELAATVPGVDVILGAHSHSFTAQEEAIDDTVMIQCGADGMFAGKLEIDFNTAERTIIGRRFEAAVNLAGAMPVDPDTQAAISEIIRHYAPTADLPVGWLKGSADTSKVAEITAAAALNLAAADAALVWYETIWNTWPAGGLSTQNMLDTYKCERQTAGTPSWNAFYRVVIDGATLKAVAAGAGDDLLYVGPDSIDESGQYVLALQKGPAMRPERFFPESVRFENQTFVGETWYVLYRFAAERTLRCIFVDSDEPSGRCFGS